MTLVRKELTIFRRGFENSWLPQARVAGAVKKCGADTSVPTFDSCVSIYLFSKSTGCLTSCTLKYFASAGYFFTAASYIA